jgi:hypothetical protein
VLLLFFLTLPTLNVSLILSSIAISLICMCIEKLGVTLHFNLELSSLYIETMNEPSASENPVRNQGLILD